MTTEYKYRVTIAVPEAMMDQANHLSILIGESVEDINTVTSVSHEDISGNSYAVLSFVARQHVIDVASSKTLPDIPEHAIGLVDISKAQAALDSINQPGGLIMAIDDDPKKAINTMGLTIMRSEEFSY